MKYVSASGVAVAAGLALGGAVQAADMPQLDLPTKPPAYVQEFFSPWYVRFDGGYRMNSLSGGTSPFGGLSRTTIDDLATVGGGVGIKWNWARADVTFDYGIQPKLSGTAGGVTFTEKLQNFTTLLNGYLDLGTWYGFTPYVGAGLGYSYLKPSDFAVNGLPLPTNQSNWTFSWAAMAGASFAVSPDISIDVGYRYLDLGQTETAIPAPGNVNFGDWTAQEIRFGLRYLIP